MILNSIDDIADRYDAVFCDVWGVIHNGRNLYAGAAGALTRLRQAGKSVILLTNIPKPRGPIPAQLDRLGFPRRMMRSSPPAMRSGPSLRRARRGRSTRSARRAIRNSGKASAYNRRR